MIDLRTAVMATMLGLPATLGPVLAQEAKDPAPPRAQTDAAASVGKWIENLGSDSFRERLAAEEQLRKLGDQALPELRKAAAKSDDKEVQWRARRLVRQIERGDAGGLVQRSPDGKAGDPLRPLGGSGLADGIGERFEQLFRDMEDQFGLDIPRAHFFQDDFFKDLQQQMQNGAARSQGMSLQIGPDGAVRVEVKETDADGKVENKVYEAPDMDTFQQQYPGVLKRGGLGLGMKLWSDDEPFRHPFFQMQRGGNSPFAAVPQPGLQFAQPVPDADVDADAQVRSGERLGVAVRPDLSAELREHLGLDDGQGLMVQSVAADSLAQDLGLRAGDIVLRIGGQSIGSPADVRSALAAIDAGQQVEVKFLRKGTEQTATAKKPAAAKAPAAKDDGKALHRRSPDGAPAKIR